MALQNIETLSLMKQSYAGAGFHQHSGADCGHLSNYKFWKWQRHGRKTYSTEIGKHYRSMISLFSRESQLLNIYQYTTAHK